MMLSPATTGAITRSKLRNSSLLIFSFFCAALFQSMSLSFPGRALHFVFKIADRKATAEFYKKILGMQTLRHEEFSEGCDAACNGPYANRWSKTMIGYGPENDHFVVELTYNYGVKNYDLGNDFFGITIISKDVIERAQQMNWPMDEENGKVVLKAPGGYKYYVIDEPQPVSQKVVKKVTLASSNLKKTVEYWNGLLGLSIIEQDDKTASFAFDKEQCLLEFKCIGQTVDHAKAYGRIAFSAPKESLPKIQKAVEDAGHKILTPLISLDTPGKATVTVVILADPDDHEICFVDDESFRELSQVDPSSDAELEKFIKRDRS